MIPNVGVVYTGNLKKQSEHGGFAHEGVATAVRKTANSIGYVEFLYALHHPMFASLIGWNPPQQTRRLALLLEPHAIEDGIERFVVFCVGGLGSNTDERNQPLGT